MVRAEIAARWLPRAALALALALAAPGALAHDTWLLAEHGATLLRGDLSVLLTTSAQFPAPGTPPALARLAEAGARLAERIFAPGSVESGEAALRLRFSGVPQGLATVWATLTPARIELSEAQVDEYLHEIDAPAAVTEDWARAGPQRRWLEIYRKNAKALVRVGDAAIDPGPAAPVGQPLELVPETDPGGGDLRVTLLRQGQPRAGVALSAVSPQGQVARKGLTDGEGRFACRLDQAGVWLIRCTDLRPPEAGTLEWQSEWASLTVETRPGAHLFA